MERADPQRYYPVRFRIDGRERLFLWCEMDDDVSGGDALLMDEHGYLLTFPSGPALKEYALAHGPDVQPVADALFDLDTIEAWCEAPDTAAIDCSSFVDAWNLFDDLLVTLGRNHLLFTDKAQDNGVYEKLFWGTNPRALVSEGVGDFVPSWTQDEAEIISAAFRRGLRNFRAVLRE